MLRLLCIGLLALAVSACFGGDRVDLPDDNTLPTGDQGGYEKVGNPYKIAGKWYYPKKDPSYDEKGLASWYGTQFHGKKTANGEVFNMNALTAAHKTLPMPSFVKVTNLSNGRSLVLRVNDRGPFVGDRLIDVSRRAAQLLGFDRQGVTKVRIQASDEKGRVLAKKKRTSDGRHFVQLGAFSSRDKARSYSKRVEDVGADPKITKSEGPGRMLWRVRLGPFNKLEKAERWLDRMMARGFYDARLLTEDAG